MVNTKQGVNIFSHWYSWLPNKSFVGSVHSTVPYNIWALNYITVYGTNIVNWYLGWDVLSSDSAIFLKKNIS